MGGSFFGVLKIIWGSDATIDQNEKRISVGVIVRDYEKQVIATMHVFIYGVRHH